MQLCSNFILRNIAVAGATLLVACGASDGWLRSNPGHMTYRAFFTPPNVAGAKPLNPAQISTKSGEILILEPDGQVTPVNLGSAEGRDAFAVTEADLAELDANLDLNLNLADFTARPSQDNKTAQERALEKFAARTRPALPALPNGARISPRDFIAARVDVLNKGSGGDLVEVKADLRRNVDPNIAYSYSVCALAGWAASEGAGYGRHIRTLQDKRNGKLLLGAAFIISNKKPLGLRVMETEQTLRECKARGIPVA